MEILEAEEDFKSSKTMLEEVMAEMGARVVWLPKFHPEFAPIECVYRCKIHTQGFSDNFPYFWLALFLPFIIYRDMSRFCRERNIIGNSRGFLDRVLTADQVVTPEKCQKYFISCQRCKQLLNPHLRNEIFLVFQVHASIQGGCNRDGRAAEDKSNQEVS